MLWMPITTWLGALVATAVLGAAEPARIVTSFSVVDDWTTRIIGPEIKHQTLVPAGSELHGFQLGANEAKALARAELIIGLSPTSEPWLADWVKAHGKEDRTLWLQTVEKDGGESDPHPWTDPSLVVGFVRKIAEEARVHLKISVSENIVSKYVAEIEALDFELKESFASVPPGKRQLITQHPNLGRLAQRYQLKVQGTILESPSAEAADPSARHYSNLLGLIRREQIRVLVTDEGQNEGIARRLCQDAGIPAPVALNFETLAPPGQPGSDWLGMMRHQSGKLREALLRP
jgi:ABC-type Zn uptake system ZnuABC Zn-binding protein ZnuA